MSVIANHTISRCTMTFAGGLFFCHVGSNLDDMPAMCQEITNEMKDQHQVSVFLWLCVADIQYVRENGTFNRTLGKIKNSLVFAKCFQYPNERNIQDENFGKKIKQEKKWMLCHHTRTCMQTIKSHWKFATQL